MYKSLKMSLDIESCSVEEACASLDGNVKLLDELRDKLEEWLQLQPHLPHDVPKKTLEYFILGTKMSLEQAKRKLDMFYTMKRLVPELLIGRDPRVPSFTALHTMFRIVYLPKLTPKKYRVSIMWPYVDDYSKFSPSDSFRYSFMIEDLLMNESLSLGSIYVFDHSMLNVGLLTKYTPAILKKIEVAITEAFAKRVKEIHFINTSSLTEILINLARKVLKPKFANRIHTHPKGNYESFYQHVPKSMLPEDYGGEEPSMAQLAEQWQQKIDKKRDWFLEQDKIVVDERLRPGPAINSDDLFGFSGSFRKLDVD